MTFPYKNEKYLQQDYEVINGKLVENNDSAIIKDLIENYLTNPVFHSDPENLDSVYFCKEDNSYWLITYRFDKKSDVAHGCGKKNLKKIDENEAKRFIEKHK